MRGLLLISGILMVLVGCTTVPSQPDTIGIDEPTSQPQSFYEGVFLAQGAEFGQYRRLTITELDVESSVNVDLGAAGFDPTTWGLTESDREYYQAVYGELAAHRFIVEGNWQTSLEDAEDVLILASRLIQEPPQTRKGYGTLTIEMSLYDALSGRLLAMLIDQRSFGVGQEGNDRSVTHEQAYILMYRWLEWLELELTRLQPAAAL